MADKSFVTTLNTAQFKKAEGDFKRAIDKFDQSKMSLFSISEVMLANWSGEGRREFEYEYTLLKGKFEDLTEALYDIYKALVEAEATYIAMDEDLARKLTV